MSTAFGGGGTVGWKWSRHSSLETSPDLGWTVLRWHWPLFGPSGPFHSLLEMQPTPPRPPPLVAGSLEGVWNGEKGPRQGLNIKVCTGGGTRARDAEDTPGPSGIRRKWSAATVFTRGGSAMDRCGEPRCVLGFQSLQDGEDPARQAGGWRAVGGASQGEEWGQRELGGLCGPCVCVDRFIDGSSTSGFSGTVSFKKI